MKVIDWDHGGTHTNGEPHGIHRDDPNHLQRQGTDPPHAINGLGHGLIHVQDHEFDDIKEISESNRVSRAEKDCSPNTGHLLQSVHSSKESQQIDENAHDSNVHLNFRERAATLGQTSLEQTQENNGTYIL